MNDGRTGGGTGAPLLHSHCVLRWSGCVWQILFPLASRHVRRSVAHTYRTRSPIAVPVE